MLFNARVQIAGVLTIGALLGSIIASAKLAQSARPCADQLLGRADSTSGAKPARSDEVNKVRLLADANRVAPSGGAATQPATRTAFAQTPVEPAADKRPRNI